MNTTQTWPDRRLHNWWCLAPESDPRLDGYSRLVLALEEAFDVASGIIEYDREHPDPGLSPIYSPLEIAIMLREAADRIERWTAPDDV